MGSFRSVACVESPTSQAGWVLVHLAILQGRADFSGVSSTQLIAVAAAWSAVSIAAFSWVLGRYRLGAVDLESSGLFGLLTSGVAALGILFCPQATYFVLWEGSALSHTIMGQLGPGASYGLFGVLYGVPPALLISAALGRSAYAGTDGGLIGAGMATLLWLPAAYLQCSALALGLLLAWAVGALAGVSGGFWFGVGVRRLVTVTMC